jgi:hypothetical protein
MKIHSVLILALVLASAPCSVAAEAAWLLTYESGRRAVVKAEAGSTQTVAYVDRPNLYGTSARHVAVLSREGRGFVLQVFDKTTRQQILSRPINAHVLTSLAGVSRELALTAQAAFFVTGRFITDGGLSQGRNNLGGLFDLNRVDLDSGGLTTIALPEDCAYARPVAFAGGVLVYSLDGYTVWKYDADRSRVEQLLATRDLNAVIASEQTVKEARDPGYVNFLPIPGSGVFHLSRGGQLQQVLTQDLKRVSAPLSAPARATEARVVRSFAATFAGAPVAGLVRLDKSGHTQFSYVDLTRQKALWSTTLAKRTIQDSVEPAGEGQIAYVDAEKAAVVKTSKAGTQTLWLLQPDPQGDFGDSRILSIE